MRIGIYHQHADKVIGGAEYFVAVVAEVLCGEQHHRVELVHHRPDLTAEQLTTHYGTKLDGLTLRYVPFDGTRVDLVNPVERYREERARNASLSQSYDLFIASVHDIPPFCHAPRGALIVHFPYFNRHTSWPWASDGSGIRKRLRRMYANWEWQKRFEGYQVKMVNSDFTRRYTEQWWDIDSQVVYAPAQTDFDVADKENVILSVGRFATGGTSKKQLEMAIAFKDMELAGLRNWTYYSVGGLSDLTADHAYFEEVCGVASNCEAHIIANIEHEKLKQLRARAKIFWHGAGYGERDTDPVLMEHFGIATVEAMAAGCVPIVIAKGGQPEIVEHQVNGFLWSTLEELKEYTTLVVSDENLRSRMSEAARVRSRTFNREAFENRLTKALQPLLV